MEELTYPRPKSDYRVFTRTTTYNQAKYITDTLDGVAMQQTDFPFVHFVMDDASTDGEPAVIFDWLNKHCDMANADYVENPAAKVIFVNHKTNANCHYAIYLLKQNTYGNIAERNRIYQPWRERCKYEAICEGDDYWTNPLKLYTQVSFMESHQDISLSCCRFDILNTRTGVKELAPNIYFDDEDVKSSFFEFTRHGAFGECGWITKTLTCVYRISAMHPEFVMQFKYGRDVHMVYDILSHGNGVCHNLNGGVYRISDSGIYGGKNNIEKALVDYQVYKEFSSKVDDPQLSEISLRNFNYLIARKHLIFPHNFRELKSYITLFKQVITRHLKVYLNLTNNFHG